MLEKILRIIIFLMAILLIAFGAFLSYGDKNTSAGLTYTAGILCLIFSFLTSFKSFKGLGIEAELQNKIDEADKIIRYLKEISEPIAEISFSSLSRMGFLMGPILKSKQYKLKKNIEKALKQIGIEDKKINIIARDWHRFNVLVLSKPLFDRINSELKGLRQEKTLQLENFGGKIKSEDKHEFDKLFAERQLIEKDIESLKNLRRDFDIDNSDQQLLYYLSESKTLSDQIKDKIKSDLSETLEDIKYYKKYYDFRRPEKWFENDDWK